MYWNRSILVCLALASFAGAQPSTPRAPKGRSVITRSVARRGYLGVGVVELTDERAKALKLGDSSGVEVRRVDENSPASKAGMKENDIILEVNGQKFDDVEDFIRMIGDSSPGSKVGLTLWRDGARQTVSATVQPRAVPSFTLPDDAPAPPTISGLPNGVWMEMPVIQSPRVGFEGEALSAQLAEYFGVKEGVLVKNVTANTAASRAGLKAGDVIVRVNGMPVANPREISSLIRVPHKAFVFTVMRNHKEVSLKVEVAMNLMTTPDRDAL